MKSLFFFGPLAPWLALLCLLPLPSSAAEISSDPATPWSASGRVTTPDGKPLAGVEIWVHTGIGSLKRAAVAKTGEDGRYSVAFGRGALMPVAETNLQAANITAHRTGYFETNLNRQGARAGALKAVSADALKNYRLAPEQLFLPDKPQQIDFVMAPAAQVKGTLLGTGSFPRLPPQAYRTAPGEEQPIAGATVLERGPLSKWRVWIVGRELPPASSVLASTESDAEGNFEFDSVPLGFEWQFQVETHEPRVEPRSPPFRVESPGAKGFELELLSAAKELRLAPKAGG